MVPLSFRMPGDTLTGERVVVYTTDFCGWCERAKSLLAARGIRFREVWLPRTLEGRNRLAEAAPFARSFPQILIDGEVLGGYRELVERDRAGALTDLAGSEEPR
jgi:glutaredoxin 3